jgi:hypothetical protein
MANEVGSWIPKSRANAQSENPAMSVDRKKQPKKPFRAAEPLDILQEPEPIVPKRIRLDEVHYELVHRYEVNAGSCCLMPSGFSCDETISAYYENIHGYHLVVSRTMDGKLAFMSDFPRETGESYSSLEEAKGSESFKGFAALVRRMNKYRREALAAFADPSSARRTEDFFEVLEKALRSIGKPDSSMASRKPQN